jgi:hypothetical protein
MEGQLQKVSYRELFCKSTQLIYEPVYLVEKTKIYATRGNDKATLCNAISKTRKVPRGTFYIQRFK